MPRLFCEELRTGKDQEQLHLGLAKQHHCLNRDECRKQQTTEVNAILWTTLRPRTKQCRYRPRFRQTLRQTNRDRERQRETDTEIYKAKAKQ